MFTSQTPHNIAMSVVELATVLRDRPVPKIAVLLGSGWGGVLDQVTDPVSVPYGNLLGFPELTVPGHEGKVVFGFVRGVPVMVLAGRKHTYENGDAGNMVSVIGTMAKLGVEVLVQTNAAGSLKHFLPTGSVMMIDDHVNNTGLSPLIGLSSHDRFVNLTNAYDAELRNLVESRLVDEGIVLHSGTYVWNLGPQFETPAEVKDLLKRGFSAVGMSTVPETILARYYKMRVLGFSLMVNMAAGESDEVLSHEHTMTSAQEHGKEAVRILTLAIEALGEMYS